MRVGQSTIPRTRIPALLKSQMILLDLNNFRGQWGIVCCLPSFDFGEAVFLNQYHRTVQMEGAVFLGMLPYSSPMPDPSLPKTKALGIPLLADPLRRLHRILGLSGSSFSNRCQSFVFDPGGVIRYHLLHRSNWIGMSFLLEILKHCQELYSPLTQPQTSRPAANTSLVSSVKTLATRTTGLSCT